MVKISILRVFIFYSIAIIVSNLFRFDIFGLAQQFSALPAWASLIIRAVLEGIGIFIGALIGISLLKKERPRSITFLGVLKSKNVVMVLIGVAALTIVGVTNEYELNKHVYGFIAVVATFMYCIMEEYGWRGYLQEELSALKPMTKYVIIGVLWYIWHLTFLTDATVQDNLFFLGMMIFGSWGIGQVADTTKSIVASACFHLIVQIMMFNALIKNGLSVTEKWIILSVCVVLWVWIIKNEKKKLRNNQKETTSETLSRCTGTTEHRNE